MEQVDIDALSRAVADRLKNDTNSYTYVNADTDTVDGNLTEVVAAVVEELRDREEKAS